MFRNGGAFFILKTNSIYHEQKKILHQVRFAYRISALCESIASHAFYGK
jgi:hypothetical protein